MASSSASLLQPVSSTNTEEDDQELALLTEQPQKSSMFDDDDDLSRQVEQCFRKDSEQLSEDNFMQIDQSKERIFLFNLI